MEPSTRTGPLARRATAAMPTLMAYATVLVLVAATATALTPACDFGQVYKKKKCVPCRGTTVKVPDTNQPVKAKCKPGKAVCKSSQVASQGQCKNCPSDQVPQNNDVVTCGPCPAGSQKVPKGEVPESTCLRLGADPPPPPPTCVPGTEICNGKDDDCDGLVDEDQGTISCGDAGSCKVTVPACVNGRPNVCTPNVKGIEICNGLDDDCDGQIDEEIPNLTCGSPIGSYCYKSVQACVNGANQTCVPNQPQNEICNGIDDNCNGLVDEGTIACGLPNSQCYRVVPACIGGQNNICQQGIPSPFESCDGIDNNCNGLVDEGFANITCGTPNSACFTTVSTCSNGTLNVVCTAKPPQTEVCNNFDDNCNGIIDDVAPVACGVGSCGVILAGCTNGTATTCNGAQLPQNVFCQPLTVNFDDLPDPTVGINGFSGQPLPSPYKFFNWTNFNYYRGNSWPQVGSDANTTQAYLAYRAAVVSQPNGVKKTDTLQPMTIVNTNGNSFDFVEVYATSLWYDNMTLTFTPTGGSGNPTAKTFYLQRGIPTKLQLLGFNAITSVSIATAHPVCAVPGSCNANNWVLDVAMDNFVFQSVSNNPFGHH